MRKKIVVLSGITGQCGSVLAEKLLERGDKVVGIVRRTSSEYKWRLNNIVTNKNLILCSGDITDQHSIDNIADEHKPDWFINTASMSHVGDSFKQPVLTGEITGLGVTKCLEAIRKFAPNCRFLQFSTSEMFGDAKYAPQHENTPFDAKSPYAAAKLYGYYMTDLYKNAYGLHCSNMIMFNTEGPRRGLNFVTRKISMAVANIYLGHQDKLVLWDLSPRRDWSYVGDSMNAAIKILEYDSPDTFVVSSGETHTIEEFCKVAFEYVGLNYKDYVVVDKSKARPSEVPLLKGDSTKIRNMLGWVPKVQFKELVEMMVESDIDAITLKEKEKRSI